MPSKKGARHRAPFSVVPTILVEPLPARAPLRSSDEEQQAVAAWIWGAALGAPLGTPSALPSSAAWLDLPTLAEGHGLAALALPAAEGLTASLVAAPAELRAAAAQGLSGLRDAAERTLRRGAKMGEDRRRLESALAAEGLEPLWLKGAYLADQMVYHPPEARPMADLDLYLPQGAWPRAGACLLRLGYRPGATTWKHQLWHSPGSRVVDLRGEHPDNPRPVELHFRLGEGFRGIAFAMDPEAAAVGRAAPRQGLRLRPEAALAQLAAHTSVNLLERRLRLIQLLDLLLLGAQLDGAAWAWLVGAGGRPQGARFLWPSLALVDRIAPGRLPAGPLEALRQACPPALMRWLGEQSLDALLWHGGPGARRALLELPRIWPIGWREELRYWQTVLLPEPSRLADRYPDLAERGRVDLMLLRHVQYNLRQFRRRLAQRP